MELAKQSGHLLKTLTAFQWTSIVALKMARDGKYVVYCSSAPEKVRSREDCNVIERYFSNER